MLQVALKVGMTCQGCVGSVQRVLSKLDGARHWYMRVPLQASVTFMLWCE